MKAFPHADWLHLYGRSLVCMRKCLCKSDLRLKLLQQALQEHWKGRGAVSVSITSSRSIRSVEGGVYISGGGIKVLSRCLDLRAGQVSRVFRADDEVVDI